MALSFRQGDDVGRLRRGGPIHLSQERRRDRPVASIGANDGHGFAIVAGQRAFEQTPMTILKPHTIADRKFEHGLMRAYLMKKAQSLDDPVVEIHQLRFAQLVNVNRHWVPAPNEASGQNRAHSLTCQMRIVFAAIPLIQIMRRGEARCSLTKNKAVGANVWQNSANEGDRHDGMGMLRGMGLSLIHI